MREVAEWDGSVPTCPVTPSFSVFQDMKSAVITPCSHFFHAGCLKKWLYVQETCPLCHCQLKSPSQLPGQGPEPVQQPDPAVEQNRSHREANEPQGVEHSEGPDTQDSLSASDGQGVEEPACQEDSVDPVEDAQSRDCGLWPAEARQRMPIAKEIVLEDQEESPTPDPRACVQI